jgi:hypothetical protein
MRSMRRCQACRRRLPRYRLAGERRIVNSEWVNVQP